MAETGCLKDGHFQNLESNNLDATVFTGGQAAFINKYAGKLPGTLTSIDQAATEAGEGLSNFVYTPTATHLMIANAVNEVAFTGAQNGQVSLPQAIQGTCCLLRFTEDPTPAVAKTLTIQTYADTDKFAYQVIGIGIPNGVSSPSSVLTDGSDAAPLSNEIKWTTSTTSSHIGAGSEFWFFCPEDKRWVVDTRAVSIVSGGVSTGGIMTVATVSL
jgi:hypothetical protein